MCGVLVVVGEFGDIEQLIPLLRHRGPDSWNHVRVPVSREVHLVHSRLAIRHSENPAAEQPFYSDDTWTVANGEIYNSEELDAASGIAPGPDLHAFHRIFSGRDSGTKKRVLLQSIRGMYAGVSIQKTEEGIRIYAVRDPLGIKPLLVAYSKEGFVLCSELYPICVLAQRGIEFTSIQDLPCGVLHVYPSPSSPPSLYPFQAAFLSLSPRIPLRDALFESVHCRLLSDGPVAVYLSGGIDSALIAAVAAKVLSRAGKWLYTFTVCLEEGGRRDADAAALVASHIGSIHEEVSFSIEEGLLALPSVVKALGIPDRIQIRAGIPLYLLSKAVSQARTKEGLRFRTVLCGEGADELFGGYGLFRPFLPGEERAHSAERIKRTRLLNSSELLRVDRCTMAHGLEARVPFLDAEVVRNALESSSCELFLSSIAPEKALLRQTFANLLPHTILTRPKEQFADGIGGEWIEALRAHASPLDEQEYYRKIAEDTLGSVGALYAQQVQSARRSIGRMNMQGARIPHRPTASALDDTDLRTMVSSFDEARQWVEQVLGVDIQAYEPASTALLKAIVSACIQKIPFQNVTIIARPRRPPTAQEVREDMWKGWGGGCIAMNTFLGACLGMLGYRTHLLCATIHQPDCHVALLVSPKGYEPFRFVDIANGKPYIDCPTLLDDSWYTHGSFSYQLRFSPSERRWEVYHRTNNMIASRAMHFDPLDRAFYRDFLPMVEQSRTDPSYGPFLRALRLCRYDKATLLAVKGKTIIEGNGRQEDATRGDILSFCTQHLGHLGPGFLHLVEETLDCLEKEAPCL